MVGPQDLVGLPTPSVPGLTDADAHARLLRDGPNDVVPAVRFRRLKALLKPFADPMVLLLLAVAPMYALLGDTTDAVVALVALLPVTAIGWILQARIERTLERLRELNAPAAVVHRSGAYRVIDARELVVDDICALRSGDVVPADCTVVEATQLSADEAVLTGESLPVNKELGDSVLAGTSIVTGRALVRVTAIGTATSYASIAALLQGASPRTPLQGALSRLVRALGLGAAICSIAVMTAALLRGLGWQEALISAISLAMASIPEEFSIVYALYLSLGAWQLARLNALVRNLPGVEALGSATVMCVDKTGTLTEGHLVVGEVVPLGITVEELLAAATLACEPDPFDALDIAVVRYAETHGVGTEALLANELLTDWEFDPQDRYVTHTWSVSGDVRVAAKGALDGIINHVTLTADERSAVELEHTRLAASGMKVIAVARASGTHNSGVRATDEQSLKLLGLIAFHDPVRPGVAAAIAECRTAGIRVVMITGDHAVTAQAIAEELGLCESGGGELLTGQQVDAFDDTALDAAIRTTTIFARVRPEQKFRLVESLRRCGEVVVMTGDGVNDAPALKTANIGVAMGERGSQVAREAATIVLLDDNFATLVTATSNGRRIYDNLTRAFAYLIAAHAPLVLSALIVPLFGTELFLQPVHLIVLEVLMHPIAAMVFTSDAPDPDLMRRPPRPAAYSLTWAALRRPLALGATVGISVCVVFLVLVYLDWDPMAARGMALATLLLCQPLLVLTVRDPNVPIWRTQRSFTWQLGVALGTIALALLATIWFAPSMQLLHVSTWPSSGWLVCLLVAAIATLWSEPFKHLDHGTKR